VSGITDEVEALITGHIDSVEKLEILLLLHGDRTQVWSPAIVSRELRRNPSSVARCMSQLAGASLISGSESKGYGFPGADPAVGRTVDRLAETYAARRVAVVQLIVSNPMDSVTTFADAFRFRRKG
jgi:hypothetical protein